MTLKFGTFMAPFHCPAGQDPTAAYERDLDVIKHMDKLGFGNCEAEGGVGDDALQAADERVDDERDRGRPLCHRAARHLRLRHDPIFVPDSDSSHRTFAKMTSEEKNKISHRRRAAEAMRNGLGLNDASGRAEKP